MPSNLFVNLSNRPVASLEEARAAGVPVIAYGSFINTVIDFALIVFVIFFMVKQINRFCQVSHQQVPLRELLPWVALSWQGAFPTDPALTIRCAGVLHGDQENRKGYRLR